jgi:hypothetical protein
MVINDFDLMGGVIQPLEADSPLIVDPNAALALTIPEQRLQAVAGRRAQVIEASGKVKLREFPNGDPSHIRWNLSASTTDPKLLRAGVGKAHDHT